MTEVQQEKQAPDFWLGGTAHYDANRAFRPTVSVIVLSKGAERRALLLEALDSVWAQTLPQEQIQIIMTSSPVYWGDKLNEAIAASRGAYFCVLCDDDLLRHTYLARCLDELAQHPEAELAYSHILLTGRSDGEHTISFKGFTVEQTKSRCVPWLSAVWSRAAYDRLVQQDGFGYDPDQQYLDWDFSRRMALMGVQGVEIDEALTESRVHDDSGHGVMNHCVATMRLQSKYIILEDDARRKRLGWRAPVSDFLSRIARRYA